jgi:hydroxymethylglutaryl-CoA reductase (NADPH)
MAGELSFMAGHLVRAHLAHNRSQVNTPSASQPATPGPGSAGGEAWPTGPPGALGRGVLSRLDSTTHAMGTPTTSTSVKSFDLRTMHKD